MAPTPSIEQMLAKGEENMNRLQGALVDLERELRGLADVASDAAYDVRSTVGEFHFANGRQTGLVEAADAVRDVREAILAPTSTLLGPNGQVIAQVPVIRA